MALPLFLNVLAMGVLVDPLWRASGHADVECLQQVKHFLVDSSGVLGSWVLDGKHDVCEFAGVVCEKGRVSSIVLAGANLGGSLPNTLPRCEALKTLNLAGNHLEGGLAASTCVQLPSLRALDLSWNNLGGGIPEALSWCGWLEELHLQHNRLSGVIPWRLGLVRSLRVLDVSYNQLLGQIPTTMVNRSEVNQQGFAFSSFQGNPDLCGPPLPVACRAM